MSQTAFFASMFSPFVDQSPAVHVGAADYLDRHPAPVIPEELSQHRCINYRMVTAHTLYAWDFERDGRPLKVSVTGPLTFNDPDLMLDAAVDGLGVAYVLEHRSGR